MLKTKQPVGFDQATAIHNDRKSAVPALAEYDEIFVDPRTFTDRRQKDEPGSIPASGCRRRGERRTMVYMKNESWWVKRDYSNAK